MAEPARRDFLFLPLILAAAFSLRLAGIGWGLPPPIPEVAASGIRSSYAFDEDDILNGLAQTDPRRLDFDPRLYHRGTFHLELVLAALEAAEAFGAFDHRWRDAFRRMIPGDFERVYVAARLVSVVVDLATILLVFLIAREMGQRTAGLWAALFLAVSPGLVLQAVQIRVDVTMTAMATLTVWLGLRAGSSQKPSLYFLVGAAGGLAIAAKYSAIFVVAAIAAIVVRRLGFVAPLLFGLVAGFLVGEPYILIRSQEVFRQVGRVMRLTQQTPEQFVIPVPTLLQTMVVDVARFSVGIPVALLSVVGFWTLLRHRSPARWLIGGAAAAGVLSVIPQRWPLLRYYLPLLPFVALAAGIAVARFAGPLRLALGTVATGVALAATLAQLHFMRAPHPANQALVTVVRTVPPGETISRLMPELPPLDPAVYPMGPGLLMGDLTSQPPAWVLTADLPLFDYPAANRRLLETGYERVEEFRSGRILGWATLGESRAPHDWKYTHPVMVLFRKK